MKCKHRIDEGLCHVCSLEQKIRNLSKVMMDLELKAIESSIIISSVDKLFDRLALSVGFDRHKYKFPSSEAEKLIELIEERLEK